MLDPQWHKTITTKSGRSLTLRYPNEDDAGALMRYINPIIEEETFIALNELQSEEKEREHLESCVKDMKEGKMVKIVAVDGDVIVAAIDARRQAYKQNHIVELGISIAKEYRGDGLGRILFDEILTQVRSLPGVKKVVLECATENVPALNLYRSFGFEEYGRLAGALQQQGRLIDEVLMSKEL